MSSGFQTPAPLSPTSMMLLVFYRPGGFVKAPWIGSQSFDLDNVVQRQNHFLHIAKVVNFRIVWQHTVVHAVLFNFYKARAHFIFFKKALVRARKKTAVWLLVQKFTLVLPVQIEQASAQLRKSLWRYAMINDRPAFTGMAYQDSESM